MDSLLLLLWDSVFVPRFVVHCFVSLSIFGIILMGKGELVAFLCLSSWCLVIVIAMWLFLRVSWVGLQCVIVVFPDHTHLLFNDICGKEIYKFKFKIGVP